MKKFVVTLEIVVEDEVTGEDMESIVDGTFAYADAIEQMDDRVVRTHIVNCTEEAL